jgi:hypothetical protein
MKEVDQLMQKNPAMSMNRKNSMETIDRSPSNITHSLSKQQTFKN